jgi:hypothetical protein
MAIKPQAQGIQGQAAQLGTAAISPEGDVNIRHD